jgi:hypothetical protein
MKYFKVFVLFVVFVAGVLAVQRCEQRSGIDDYIYLMKGG